MSASPSTINVTVLGLNRLGASLARRLVTQPRMRLSGYDRDSALAQQAQRAGVLHKAQLNMLNSVEQADLVLLTGTLAEQHESLRLMAPVLRAGSVVVPVSPLLAPPLAWAAELLAGRAERHLVAAHPALNPALLYTGETGYDASSASLFEKALFCLAPAPGCAPEAARLVSDVAELLGAFPYFVDAAEHDGLAAASEGLPALLAVALMQAAAASPGWGETRKLADRALATASVALVDADPEALRANRDNLLRYLDAALAALQALRQHLAEGVGVDEDLARALAQRAAWLAERQRGDWEHLGEAPSDMPSSGDMLGRFLVGGLLSKRADDASGGPK
jgi:prephenate dehydrogenase